MGNDMSESGAFLQNFDMLERAPPMWHWCVVASA